jgi:hypothetical protein
LEIFGMMAARGARWRPRQSEDYRSFRKDLAKANPSAAIDTLEKLMQCGFVDAQAFKELMSTPPMRELLCINRPGVIRLREMAGFADPNRPRNRGEVGRK